MKIDSRCESIENFTLYENFLFKIIVERNIKCVTIITCNRLYKMNDKRGKNNDLSK